MSKRIPEAVLRFFEYNPFPQEVQTRVISHSGDCRRDSRGICVASVGIKHVSGYGILVKMDGGGYEVFSPMSLMPELEPAPGATEELF